MTKSRYKSLPHHTHFFKKIFKNLLIGFLILIFSLGVGVWGYMHFFNLPWVDALLNASMILGGMGPVDVANNDGGKLFAAFYALYSGIAFLTGFAVIFAPVLHRFLHQFHLDTEE